MQKPHSIEEEKIIYPFPFVVMDTFLKCQSVRHFRTSSLLASHSEIALEENVKLFLRNAHSTTKVIPGRKNKAS